MSKINQKEKNTQNSNENDLATHLKNDALVEPENSFDKINEELKSISSWGIKNRIPTWKIAVIETMAGYEADKKITFNEFSELLIKSASKTLGS